MPELKLSARKFELLCVSLLGFGHLCIMTGCDSMTFILESVIHSINEREPDRIDAHAGYYGLAVLYFTFLFTCLFSPSFLYATSAKVTLFVSSVCFTSFPLGFLFTNKYYFYFSAALNGFGFALYYTGNGGYLTSHSSRKTIESNASISWAIGSSCMLCGSIIIAIITYITSSKANAVADVAVNMINSTVTNEPFERRFSENEIFMLFSVFVAISVIGNIAFLCIPKRDSENCIESSHKTVAFADGIKLMYRAMRSPKMFILVPMFLLTGVHTSLWISVYPTSLTFNRYNASLIYLPAIYSLGIGIGETIMGTIIAQLSRRIKNFGLRPAMFIGCFLASIFCFLILLTTPPNSTMAPTSDEPLLFQPTQTVVLIIAILGGMSDCCLCSVRSIICAINMPNRRDQAYSVSKFYQSIGTCVMFFLSPMLNVYYYTIGIPVIALVASICFYRETARIKLLEGAMTMEMEQEQQEKKISQYEKF